MTGNKAFDIHDGDNNMLSLFTVCYEHVLYVEMMPDCNADLWNEKHPPCLMNAFVM